MIEKSGSIFEPLFFFRTAKSIFKIHSTQKNFYIRIKAKGFAFICY